MPGSRPCLRRRASRFPPAWRRPRKPQHLRRQSPGGRSRRTPLRTTFCLPPWPRSRRHPAETGSASRWGSSRFKRRHRLSRRNRTRSFTRCSSNTRPIRSRRSNIRPGARKSFTRSSPGQTSGAGPKTGRISGRKQSLLPGRCGFGLRECAAVCTLTWSRLKMFQTNQPNPFDPPGFKTNPFISRVRALLRR